jgi:hypothetical protein
VALTRFTIDVDGMTIEGEGVVTVTGAPPANPGEALAEFLAQVDAETLERQALERSGMGETSLTATMLDLLVEMAAGQVPG